MWSTLTPGARVFAVFTMVLGPVLPIAGAPEEQATTAAIQRVTGPLLDQITGMDVGRMDRDGDRVTLTRAEGTYVFENITRHKSGAASVSVSVYDTDGRWVRTITFNKGIHVVDDNRIDFEAVVTSAGETASRTVNGSMAGLRDRTAQAVGMIDATGQTRLVMIDYGGISSSERGAPVTLTPMDSTDIVPRSVGECAVVVVVVVVFVAFTCLAFGWWGC